MRYARERWTFSPSGRDAGGREGIRLYLNHLILSPMMKVKYKTFIFSALKINNHRTQVFIQIQKKLNSPLQYQPLFNA